MKKATLRELRHHPEKIFGRLEKEKKIQITKRGLPIGILSTPPKKKRSKKRVAWPDFKARLKKIYGKKVIPYNPVLKEREESRW